MTICVYGAASKLIEQKYIDEGFLLGKTLAEKGHSLVFGAGSEGLMGAVARGFKAGGGKVHGVIPTFFEENGYEAIFYEADKITYTADMAERKTTMENECDAFIITPGGIGTFEEFFQALTLKQLGRHGKAIVVFNCFGYYDDMKNLIDTAIKHGFINKECAKLVGYCSTVEEVVKYIETYSSADIDWNLLKRSNEKL